MATAIIDEWTEEKCLQLIREFRARPVLWDQRNRFFFKKTVKPQAWEEVGEVLNVSPDRCKHKMIILMSSFRREKAKIVHSIKNNADLSQAYKSTWFAFKDMAFLMDKENERKRQLNPSEDDDDDYNPIIRNHVATPPMKKIQRPVSVKKEVDQNLVDTLLQEDDNSRLSHSTPGPSQTVAERDEEIKSFTSFIGNKMKKYTDATKNAVQQAICEIIFKADQNYYEPHCFEKFTIVDDDTNPEQEHNRSMYDSQVGTTIKVQIDSDNSD